MEQKRKVFLLYVIDPEELEIFVCGQKNYKDESKSVVIYRIYHEGKMKKISPENARKMALRRRPSEQKNMVMIRSALHGVDLTEEELQAIKCLSKLESDKVKNIISAFPVRQRASAPTYGQTWWRARCPLAGQPHSV